MLHTSSLTASAVLRPSQMEETLSNMSSSPWKPALVESRRALVNLAGVADRVQLPSRLDGADYYGRLNSLGDIYFLEGDVYFSLFSFESFRFLRMTMLEEGEEKNPSGIEIEIEVGIISQSTQGLDDKLKSFSKQFSSALPDPASGRRAEVRWKRAGDDRISRKGNAEEGERYRFSQPSYGKSEIEASRVLSCNDTRRLLIDISQAGFARIRDITNTAKQDAQRIESVEFCKQVAA